jgi:hypothetical protein
MSIKEKAHQSGGPLPNTVLADGAEDSRNTLILQASHLANAYLLPPATARTVARLHYGDAA